jgi:hypothetical protein
MQKRMRLRFLIKSAIQVGNLYWKSSAHPVTGRRMNANLFNLVGRQFQRLQWFWFIAVLTFVLAACGGGGGGGGSGGGGGNPAAKASITIAIGFDGGIAGLHALTATADDVASVTIDVTEGDTELVSAFALTHSGGTWSGTISDLPAGVALTFAAHAYDDTPTEIFSGTAQASLSADGPNSLTIDMAPADGGNLTLPRIVSIAVPSEITVDTSVTVLIDLEGSADETLDWTLTAETDGGSFDPASGSLPLSSGGTGTLSVTYTAPASEGTYTHTIHVTNGAGNAVEADFPTVVVIALAAGGLSVRFPPVVTAITGKRSGSTVTWTATAVGDDSCCDHAWSASLSGGTSPALRDPPTSNPAFLDGYDQTVGGTVSVQVSDGTGLTTTATVTLPGGQFPDGLVVNDWVTRASMPTARTDLGVVEVGGTIYAIGGVNENLGNLGVIEAYRPATNTWSMKTLQEGSFLINFHSGSSAVVLNGLIYLLSVTAIFEDMGQWNWWSVFALDPVTGQITGQHDSVNRMMAQEYAPATVAVGGLIYQIGGKPENVSLPDGNGVWAYDPSNFTWTRKTDMPTSRYNPAGALANGIIYVIGGDGGCNTVEAYDPVANTWSGKTSLPAPYSACRAKSGIAVADGIIYVVGIEDDDSVDGNEVVMAYNPSTDSWTRKPNVPTTLRSGLPRHSMGWSTQSAALHADLPAPLWFRPSKPTCPTEAAQDESRVSNSVRHPAAFLTNGCAVLITWRSRFPIRHPFSQGVFANPLSIV